MKLPIRNSEFKHTLDFIPSYNFKINKAYAAKFDNTFKFRSKIAGKNDIESVITLCNLVHKSLKHDGVGIASKSNAYTILKEAKLGRSMRCVEYGIVLFEFLRLSGFIARTISLRTKDIEIREYGGGHVAVEVYLPSINKWVFVDSQFNCMPFLNKHPLNAIELRDAIINNFDEVEFRSSDGTLKKEDRLSYIFFILQYLFYISFTTDISVGYNRKQLIVRLGPKGSKNPKKYQGKYVNENVTYTNSTATFYHNPIL